MSASMYFRGYGLVIKSDMDLPELLPAAPTERADLVIRRGTLHRSLPTAPEYFDFAPERQKIDFQAVGKFEIRGVSEIVVDPNPGLAESVVRIPLLGSVMALLLHLRGAFVLHASAVLVNGTGVAFLGDKRAGKSTTGGVLVSRGHQLITDDVLALRVEDEITMLPGFPQMKLTEESSSAIQLKGTSRLPLIEFPGFDKYQHQIGRHFSDQTARPKRLYILDRGEAPTVHAIDHTEAFQALMRFSYLVRFGRAVISTGTAPTLMRHAARIAQAGLVKRLVIPNDLSRLVEAGDLIESDLRGEFDAV